MIVSESEVHHWSRLDLPIYNHGTKFCSMHSKDSGLWRIDDGRERSTTDTAETRHREAPALHVGCRELADAGTLRERRQVARDGVGIATSVQVEALLSALAFVPPCALDHFPHHLIERQIGIHRIAKIPDPRRAIDVLERSALHHAFIEPIDHAFPMEGITKVFHLRSMGCRCRRWYGRTI